MHQDIQHNIEQILQRMAFACQKAGRSADEVKLLMATKTVDPERIKIAFSTGQTLIAENKVQELKDKYEALLDSPHTNHFIGHLQTNKIKEILRYDVKCLQSLDRLELAEKLQARLEREDKTLEVFIQVNTSDEHSKFGVAPEHALELTQQVAQFDRLKITGLMTIGLFSAQEERIRPCFKLLKQIQQNIYDLGLDRVEPKELSMGMSGDLEIAIEEGATIIRIGTAIFGQRQYPDSHYWKG